MKIFAETDRLILREILPEDEQRYFEMDSDPEVQRYVGNKAVEHINEVREKIRLIRQRSADNGIDRWAVVEKASNNFIGWTGLRLIKEMRNSHTNYYDLGYRLMKASWGKGFATEAAEAVLNYGFTDFNLSEIYASVDIENSSSIHVLTKVGFQFIETFYNAEEIKHNWYRMEKSQWGKRK